MRQLSVVTDFLNRLLSINYFHFFPFLSLLQGPPMHLNGDTNEQSLKSLSHWGSAKLAPWCSLWYSWGQSQIHLYFFTLFFICFTDDSVVIGIVSRSGQKHCFLGNEAAGTLKEMFDFSPHLLHLLLCSACV